MWNLAGGGIERRTPGLHKCLKTVDGGEKKYRIFLQNNVLAGLHGLKVGAKIFSLSAKKSRWLDLKKSCCGSALYPGEEPDPTVNSAQFKQKGWFMRYFEPPLFIISYKPPDIRTRPWRVAQTQPKWLWGQKLFPSSYLKLFNDNNRLWTHLSDPTCDRIF